MQQYTVESFTTGERRTATAADVFDALADRPEPGFTLIRTPNTEHRTASMQR